MLRLSFLSIIEILRLQKVEHLRFFFEDLLRLFLKDIPLIN